MKYVALIPYQRCAVSKAVSKLCESVVFFSSPIGIPKDPVGSRREPQILLSLFLPFLFICTRVTIDTREKKGKKRTQCPLLLLLFPKSIPSPGRWEREKDRDAQTDRWCQDYVRDTAFLPLSPFADPTHDETQMLASLRSALIPRRGRSFFNGGLTFCYCPPHRSSFFSLSFSLAPDLDNFFTPFSSLDVLELSPYPLFFPSAPASLSRVIPTILTDPTRVAVIANGESTIFPWLLFFRHVYLRKHNVCRAGIPPSPSPSALFFIFPSYSPGDSLDGDGGGGGRGGSRV